jgi:hypothetical protein
MTCRARLDAECVLCEYAAPRGGQIIVLGNSLAGYAQTKSGRRVVFMIAVGNVPIRTVEAFYSVVADQARMVVAIHRSL